MNISTAFVNEGNILINLLIFFFFFNSQLITTTQIMVKVKAKTVTLSLKRFITNDQLSLSQLAINRL